MGMSLMYDMSVLTFGPLLRRLEHLIDKAEHHAAARDLDPRTLIEARLAPDMFTFAQQVRAGCEHAKDTALRLARREPPAIEIQDGDFAALRTRIRLTLELVNGVPPGEYEGAESRRVTRPLPNNRVLEMEGAQFLREWALPQFYFHLVTAYDILRHAGVEIGKRDFLTDVWGAVRTR
jgi:hypothetical protein